MPKNKKEESSSDSDEGPIDRNPPASKKAKMGGKGNQSAQNSKPNADSNEQWILQGRKMVRLSNFKGKSYVDIREFYEKDGDLLPGKKGISLNPEQWRKLVSLADEITQALSNSC